MIEFIAGNFAEKTPSHVVVEANGIGYLVHVSLSTYEEINVLNAGKLLIHYSVSVDVRSGESKHQLYGFSSSHERQLFRQLITVSGVSSSISSTILSAFKAHEIQSVIVNGDSQTLTTVKGVGPKLAQKIVGELREKLAKSDFASDISKSSGNSLRQEALSALIALGFDRAGSAKVINELIKNESPSTVEELIKKALKQF